METESVRRATRPTSQDAFVVLGPRSLVPVVLTCEHASLRVPSTPPPDFRERRILRTHWGWDPGAWQITRELSRRLKTSAVGGKWSRLWVDLNRRVDDPTLIRREADGVELSWNAGLDDELREQRVLTYHTPYHEVIDRLIVRRLVRGRHPLLFAIHTFTAALAGRPRRFDAGVLYERDRGLAQRLAGRLRDAGLRVRYNQPYSGMAGMMYSVDRHGKHHGLPCLELELNQDLFEESSAAARLATVVEGGIRELLEKTAR
jgi:predicted N-formylglutamate amidohydrolase